MNEAWSFAHSIICPISRQDAWNFWTDVSNWKLDSDIESVELNGAFTGGAEGATITRSSGRIEWRVVSVAAGEEAVIETPLPGATGQFHWTFEDSGDHTRITQRVSVHGEDADALATAMAPLIESSIPAGMAKLCDAMTRAFTSG